MAGPEAGTVQVTVMAEDETGVLYRWTRSTPASSPLRELTRRWAKEHFVPEDAVGYAYTAKRGAQEDLDVGKSSQHYGWSSGEEIVICAFPLDEGLAEARRAASDVAPPRKRGRRAKGEPDRAAAACTRPSGTASAAAASPPAPPSAASSSAAAAAARPPAAAPATAGKAGAPAAAPPAPVSAAPPAAAEARPPAAAPAPAKAEVEAKAKAEVEAKSKSEAEAKVKAEAKADAEAEAKAKTEAKAKAEAEAQNNEAEALADKAEAEAKEAPARGPGAAAAGEEAVKRPPAKDAYSGGDRYTQFSGEPPPAGDDPIEYVQQNPKKVGSQGHERYEKYKVAKTPNEALSLGSAKGDLLHDWKKGFYKRAG